MALMAYTSLEVMRTYIGLDVATGFDELLRRSIEGASRAVDLRCNRYFGQSEEPQTRTFDATGHGMVIIDDLTDVTDIEIEGVSHATLLPRNGIVSGQDGFPYTRIRSSGICRGMEITVTGTWGWAEVPDPIVETTKMVAAEMFMQKDVPLGIKGMQEFGLVRIRERLHITDNLNLYTRNKFGVT